ncbi:MAG: molybdopterin-binding protein [Sebaldella sp.]|nr:molybdopterin-binding protein [Sebaldella sp.]
MKKIKVNDSVGMELCHDITQIIPGKFKGVRFSKGHIIKEEDVEVLQSLGKEHIFIWEEDENYVHENDAAEFISKLVIGEGMHTSEVKEGKINFIAENDGIIKINVDILNKVNGIGEIIVATRYTNSYVKKGEVIAATRIIPLRIEKQQLEELEKLVKNENVMSVKEINTNLKIGLITTGSEIFYGKIKDKSREVLSEKLGNYNIHDIEQVFVPDEKEKIKERIMEFEKKKDVIMCTGGMSIDPDDITPSAIRECGGELIAYGTPVLPGSMFLLAYKGDKVLMGLPGGVIFSPKTVFDLILPRVLACDKITKKDIVEMGHGGMLK